MEKEWETEPDLREFYITQPSWMRVKMHKRKRIDKKWLKRYSFQLKPVTAHGIVRRNDELKNLNGYVGLPKGHIHYGIHYGNLDEKVLVHGGLNFSDFTNGHSGFKCGYWYFGFDTGHFMDYVPGIKEKLSQIGRELPKLRDIPLSILSKTPFEFGEVYRNMAYVTEECESMAKQLLLAYPVHLFGVDFDIDELEREVKREWEEHGLKWPHG